MSQATIYTTPTCTYCAQAKAYFQQRNVPYVERDVSVDQSAAIEMVHMTGQQGVPVISVGGEVVVGFDRRRIDQLLAATNSSAPRKPSLGLAVADASRIALEHGVVPIFGAYVGRVAQGSPGQRVGVQPGDIVTEVNLRPVRNAADLEKAMESVSSGSQISLVWIRGQQTLRSQVSL